MKLIQDTVDLENTSEQFVSGIAAVTELAPGVLRVTYYSMRENDAGHRENFVTGHQIWAASQWLDAINAASKAWKEMRAMRGQPKLVQAAGMH
jgi:hypothetical protein